LHEKQLNNTLIAIFGFWYWKEN